MNALVSMAVWAGIHAAAAAAGITWYLPALRRKYSEQEDAENTHKPAEEGTLASRELTETKQKGQEAAKEEERTSAAPVFRLKLLPGVITAAALGGLCGFFSARQEYSTVSLLIMAVTMGVLLLTSLTDLEMRKIPNPCVLAILILRGISFIPELVRWDGTFWQQLLGSVLACAGIFVLLLLAGRISRGGVGMGDVKLLSALGFLCGIRGVMCLMVVTFVLCSLAAAGLLIFGHRHLKDSLAMAPFIYISFGLCSALAVL